MPEFHQGEARKLDQLVFGGASAGEVGVMTRGEEPVTQRSGSKMGADTKKESAR